MTFSVISGTLAAAVATSGTFTSAYPTPRTGGDYQGGIEHKLVINQRTYSAPADFTIAFAATLATITWKGTNTLASGTPYKLQLDIAGSEIDTGILRTELAYLRRIDLGSPIATVATNVRAAATVLTTAALAMLITSLDIPRNLIFTSSGNDTGITFTVVGKDEYGVTMSEVITGANAGVAAGVKAFKTLTSITPSAAAAGTVSIGVGNVLGLPIHVPSIGSIILELLDGVLATAGTKVAGLSPLLASTTTTADVRGTYVPNSAPNAARAYTIFVLTANRVFLGSPQA